MKKNIFFWGAKFKAGIIYNFIKNHKLIGLNKNLKIKYLFDPGLSRPQFDSCAKFSNNRSDLKNFLKDSHYFITCIGNHYGKARLFISNKLEKKKLKPLRIISKYTQIADKKNLGKGVQVFPGVIINENSKIGDYTILNTASLIEHDCQIGSGVHIMPGAVLGGNVKIKNFVTVGINATILPGLTIEEGSFIGAGSVVTKNVKKNQIVAGNPAKFLKKNLHKVITKFL